MQEGIDLNEQKWLIDRSSRITSSNIVKLFMKGTKKAAFGKVAIAYIDDIIFQIRRGDLVDQVDAWQMNFGKENEPLAIEWLKDNCGMDEIIHAISEDGVITFKKALGECFGDSPDYFVKNSDGVIYAVGEIKCPANKKKACNAIDKWTREGCVNEYRHQFVGHFIGSPEVNELHYTVYNAHANKITGKYYNEGVTFIYTRKEFEGLIDQAEYRIPRVYEFIKLCLEGHQEVEEINDWWKFKEYETVD